MRAVVLAVLAMAACTRQVEMGEACSEAKQCGKGADCYRGVCTPLCADDGECDGELVCARHHCLLATGEPRAKADDREPISDGRLPKADDRDPKDAPLRPGIRPRPAGVDLPPDPATMAADLKSLHSEIERLRTDQQELREAIKALEKRR